MKSLFRSMNKRDSYGYKYLLRIAILICPLFIILDWLIYPMQTLSMAIIRIFLTIYLVVAYVLVIRLNKKNHPAIIMSCIYLGSLSISLMCIISGEGFNSPYYVGVLQIFISSALLINISPRYFAPLVAVVVIQHFVILWAASPPSPRGLYVNLFGLGIFSMVCVAIHRFIYNLMQENRSLRGIVPICSKCKKIRDDEGYWQDVAFYITKHTEAEFSHSYCPRCAEELYAELYEILPKKQDAPPPTIDM